MNMTLQEPTPIDPTLDPPATSTQERTAGKRDRWPAIAPLRAWLQRPLFHRFRPLQIVVLVLATIAPVVIASSIGLALLGVLSTEALIAVALGAGENPGIITFGAMFLATPVQRFTCHSQVRVRKYLGIVFFLLALSNGAMFVLEAGLGLVLSAPFLIAGTVAVALSLPLFVTSNRRVQRAMGIRRWRLLHKLTYVVAIALLAHVVLVGDIGPGTAMIAVGFVGRIPAVTRWLDRRATRRRTVRQPARRRTPAMRGATSPRS